MSVRSAIERVAPGLVRVRTLMVNLYLVGDSGRWVLVDCGLGGFGRVIRQAARDVLGTRRPPEAIVLTHAHFDHVGSLAELVRTWDVPVFCHADELPFVTGSADYSPPDPTVGGLMALLSVAYPRAGIRTGGRAQVLPAGGAVPGAPGWRWIHTPGHTPGHVSLFRDDDRTLIAGDAFVTTRQESALSVATQRLEINGPPAYFTPNRDEARDSVARLAALRPALAATGHGAPMLGEPLARGLAELARDFDRRAVPHRRRAVPRPA